MSTQTVPLYHPTDWLLQPTGEPPGNPFMVKLWAIVDGPGNTTLRCPGFYRGDGEWCIRFAPQAQGRWTLRTLSDWSELAGHELIVEAATNSNPKVHGPLRVDPANPHHFRHADGTPYFLMGYEINWLWAMDQTAPDTPRIHALLDMIAEAGFNHVMINAFAYDCNWCKGKTRENDYGPPELLPWIGTHEDPDFEQLNPAYFDHYDRVMRAMHERGIVAHMYLKVYNKMVNWPERCSAAEDLYFDYIVARYQAFGNVVWDFSKETYNEPDKPYVRDRLLRIREMDALGQPTTVHDDWYFTYSDPFRRSVDFLTDQNHGCFYMTAIEQRTRGLGPVLNAEYGYEWGPGGEDDLTYRRGQSPLEVLNRTYEVLMAGAYPTYYYTNHAWDVIEWDQRPAGLDYYKHLHRFFTSLDWQAFDPRPELANNMFMMTKGEDEMILFGRAGFKWRNIVAMQAWEGSSWSGQVMDIETGHTKPAAIGPLTAGRRQLINDWLGEAGIIAHLKRN